MTRRDLVRYGAIGAACFALAPCLHLAEPTKALASTVLDNCVSEIDCTCYYEIRSAIDPNYAIDLNAASDETGAAIQIYEANDSIAQEWHLEPFGDGSYSIMCRRSSMVIDAKNGGTSDKTVLWQYDYNGTKAQLWNFELNEDGTFTIVNAGSGKAIDISGGIVANKKQLQIYTKNDTLAQKWYLILKNRYPDQLINGDFEYTPIKKVILSTSPLYAVYIDPDSAKYAAYSKENGWKVFSEIDNFSRDDFGWRSAGRLKSTQTNKAHIVECQYDPMDDNVYAEIYSDDPDSPLYQDIATKPRTLYRWTLNHASLDAEYIDSMSVNIGTVFKQTPQQAVRTTVNGNGDKLGQVGTQISTHVSNANNRDHGEQWETYTGAYYVPENQYVTRFSYQSITTRTDSTVGNLVDGISFAEAFPVYYDPNGGTSANILDPEENDYAGYHSAEDEVAIENYSAQLDGYGFVGWSFEKANTPVKNVEEFEKIKAPDPFVMPDHAVTLYAVWGSYEIPEDPVKSAVITD